MPPRAFAVVACGQTSSGKTHTMEGPSIHDPDLAGVIPRTVREIFLTVAEAPDSIEFIIKASSIIACVFALVKWWDARFMERDFTPSPTGSVGDPSR